MIDPATADVAFSLLGGVGAAILVVLLLLGVRRLVSPRPRPTAAPPVEPVQDVEAVPSGEQPEAALVPQPRDAAEEPEEAESVPLEAEVEPAEVESAAAEPAAEPARL